MEEEVTKEFGDKVYVSYVDLNGKDLKQYPDIKRLISGGYPAPFVIIQGKPRFAGGINTDGIIETIGTLMNTK